MDNKLIDILSMRRAHASKGEAEFIAKYLSVLPDVKGLMNDEDEVIAYMVEVNPKTDTNLTSKIMWSCHIDTMHKETAGVDKPTTQEVFVTDDGVACVSAGDDCLGADDGAGIWLMLSMIEAGVRGTYMFHRGEERGCWGSKQVVKHHSDWLAKFTHAIAFDRRGTTSVITHQRGERACSDALGEQLIGLLNMKHDLDPTGVYTDTAEYMDIIPECVNISVGYQNEHSSRETLDVSYIHALREAMLKVDWDNVDLKTERDPAVREYDSYDAYGGWGSKWAGSHKSNYGYGGYPYDAYTDISVAEVMGMDYKAIREMVKDAKIDDLTWLIMDMVDKVAELEYDLDFYVAQAEALEADDDKLDVGMR